MSQGDALIGHTGFVGSNLLAASSYAVTFNSKNIGEIQGSRFDRIICAGVSAKKWIANSEPEADKAAITRLTDLLETVQAERFILISTVDVFASSSGADEATVPERRGLHAYGLHRLELEDFVRARFPRAIILRLPALFGPGLQKNVLFDLLHDNLLQMINPEAAFQWYPVPRLPADIAAAERAELELVHLATEPLRTREIIDRFFPDKTVGAAKAVPPYDLRTRHAAVLGGQDPYIMRRDAVLRDIGHFINNERKR